MPDEHAEYNTEDPVAQENPGGRGALFQDPHHVRQDARMVASAISCGVLSDQQAADLLKGAAILGAKAIKAGKARDYAACMRVLFQGSQMALEREKQSAPRVALQNNVVVNNDTALDQKRQLQIEREQLLLEQMRGDVVHLTTVVAICEKMGRCMAEVIQMVAKESPDLAEDVRGKFESLEVEINQDLAEE